jgi:membrane fusion protein, copper/silver efflux system
VSSPVPAKDEMGMDYIPVYENGDVAPEGNIPGHAEIFVSAERQQLIGVKTEEIKEMPLYRTVRAPGNVGYDPDLYESFSEYVEALEAYRRGRLSRQESVRMRAEDLLAVTEAKMRLAGLGDEQIKNVIRYAQPTRTFVLGENSDWVYADIYEQEAGLMAPEESVAIKAPAFPTRTFKGKVKTVDPVLNEKSRTLRIRIEVEDPERFLRSGMSVDVEIQVPFGKLVAVPIDAVLNTGEMQLVFVDQGDGHLEPRRITLGDEANEHYEVLAGLKAGEKVVTSANFLIDSESRLRAAVRNFKKSDVETEIASSLRSSQ